MSLKLKLLGNILLVALADVAILINVHFIYKKGLHLGSLENIILLVTALAVGIVGIVDAKENFKQLLVERQWRKSYHDYDDMLDELEEEDEKL